MNGRVTIEDVARAAGVSRQTVSRVLNDKSDVSPGTRLRILQIIDELGYRPSRLARGLATARTGSFGLVLPDVANPFFAEVVRGAEDVATERDASVFVCNTDENPQRELAALRSLDAQHVDGIMLCSPRLSDEELLGLIPRLPPLVLVNHHLPHADAWNRGSAGDAGVQGGVNAVLVDDAAGAALAVQHLWHGGRRQIGLLAGPPISHSGRRRAAGYRSRLSELGLKLDPGLIRHCRATAAGGREAAEILLAERPELTALIAYNDLVAAGALQACRDIGRRVPEDVAIVGCDDVYMAALVTPALTTLRVSGRGLGQEAMRLLLRQLDLPSGPTREIWMQPALVIRDSAP